MGQALDALCLGHEEEVHTVSDGVINLGSVNCIARTILNNYASTDVLEIHVRRRPQLKIK